MELTNQIRVLTRLVIGAKVEGTFNTLDQQYLYPSSDGVMKCQSGRSFGYGRYILEMFHQFFVEKES